MKVVKKCFLVEIRYHVLPVDKVKTQDGIIGGERKECQSRSTAGHGSVCMMSQMKPLMSPIAQSAESVLESVTSINVTRYPGEQGNRI